MYFDDNFHSSYKYVNKIINILKYFFQSSITLILKSFYLQKLLCYFNLPLYFILFIGI